jgi:flavodoxin
MKTLVSFYSRSGSTRRVAEVISKNLNADIDEIKDLKDRTRRIIGWLVSGRDAMTKKLTKIKYSKNPSKYDLVIIGTPVWAWTVTPAIRTYLSENKFKKVAFFCTCGGQPGNTFREMKRLSKQPLAELDLIDKKLSKPDSRRKIKDFCGHISSSIKYIN